MVGSEEPSGLSRAISRACATLASCWERALTAAVAAMAAVVAESRAG